MNEHETTKNTLIQLKDKMNENDYASISSLESDDHRYTTAINTALDLITSSESSKNLDNTDVKLNIDAMNKLKGQLLTFNLWMEGYKANGNSSEAHYLGTFEAASFEEACDKWADTLDVDSKRDYHRNNNSAVYWGCRIFDNESDARKSFG